MRPLKAETSADGYDSDSPICRIAAPRVTIPTEKPGYTFPAGDDFTAHFSELTSDLRARRYARASRFLARYVKYDPGDSSANHVVANRLFMRYRFHDSFVSLHQEDFCSGHTPLNPQSQESGAEVVFDRALAKAVVGDLRAARTFARESYLRDRRFGEGLLLAGELDLALHDPRAAHDEWLRAVIATGYAFPEDSYGGHSDFSIDAAIDLVEFRP